MKYLKIVGLITFFCIISCKTMRNSFREPKVIFKTEKEIGGEIQLLVSAEEEDNPVW